MISSSSKNYMWTWCLARSPKVIEVVIISEMEDYEHQSVIKYLQMKGLTPKEVYEDMLGTLGRGCPCYTTINSGIDSLEWATPAQTAESLQEGQQISENQQTLSLWLK